MCKISVLIPVYNVEDYLKECLDSVCSQSFKDIEIICVNDGSSDDSLNILKNYSDVDSRIRIISQRNKGLGAARNNALKHANGKYIYFLDSDDYIDLKTLEILYNNALSNDSDIVLYKFRIFDDNKNVHSRHEEYKIDEIFGDIDYSNFVFSCKDVKKHVLNTAFSACLKLYKKEFLDLWDDLYFPEGLSFEDIVFHVKVMIRASKISFVPNSFYYYRSNLKSILNFSFNALDIFRIIDLVEEFLHKNNCYSEFEDEFIFFKISQILAYIISAKSQDYFSKAKEEFLNLHINDMTTLKKYAIDGYNLVCESNNYEEYLILYYSNKISTLNKKNNVLINENNSLKQLNEELVSSKSWKLTKPLRILKNFRK